MLCRNSCTGRRSGSWQAYVLWSFLGFPEHPWLRRQGLGCLRGDGRVYWRRGKQVGSCDRVGCGVRVENRHRRARAHTHRPLPGAWSCLLRAWSCLRWSRALCPVYFDTWSCLLWLPPPWRLSCLLWRLVLFTLAPWPLTGAWSCLLWRLAMSSHMDSM